MILIKHPAGLPKAGPWTRSYCCLSGAGRIQARIILNIKNPKKKKIGEFWILSTQGWSYINTGFFKKTSHAVTFFAKKLTSPYPPDSMLLHRFAWKGLQRKETAMSCSDVPLFQENLHMSFGAFHQLNYAEYAPVTGRWLHPRGFECLWCWFGFIQKWGNGCTTTEINMMRTRSWQSWNDKHGRGKFHTTTLW